MTASPPPRPPSAARLAVALPLAFSLVALPLWGELSWWLRRDDRLFRYLLGSFALSGAAMLVLGALLLRGRRVPAAALLAAALAPAFAGASAGWYEHARTLGAQSDFREEFVMSTDPIARLRLLASFEESSTKPLSCGALVSGLLALALAVLVTFSYAGGAPAQPSGRRVARAALAAAVSAACLGASAAAHLRQGEMGREAWLALGALAVGAVLATVLAAMGQRAASAPRGLIPVALAASVLLLGYAGYEDAILGQLVALQRPGRPLYPEELAVVMASPPPLHLALMDGALALVMSAAPWIAGLAPRGAPAPRRYRSVLACGALAGLLTAALVSAERRMDRDIATIGAPVARFFRIAGVELPIARGDDHLVRAEAGRNDNNPPALFLTRAGELLIDNSQGERPPVPFTPGMSLGVAPPILAADRGVSFGQLAKALEPLAGGKHLQANLVVAVRPPERREGPARFPEVYTDEILFRELWFVPRLELDKPWPLGFDGPPTLGILRDQGSARWVPLPVGQRSWPVPVGRTPEDRSARASIYATYATYATNERDRQGFHPVFVAPAPEVLLDDIIQDVEEVGVIQHPSDDRDEPRFGRNEPRIGPLVITPDRAALEAAAARVPPKPVVFIALGGTGDITTIQGVPDEQPLVTGLRKALVGVNRCLRKELADDRPSLPLEITVTLAVARDGKLRSIKVSRTGHTATDRCVLGGLNDRIEFAPTREAGVVRAVLALTTEDLLRKDRRR